MSGTSTAKGKLVKISKTATLRAPSFFVLTTTKRLSKTLKFQSLETSKEADMKSFTTELRVFQLKKLKASALGSLTVPRYRGFPVELVIDQERCL